MTETGDSPIPQMACTVCRSILYRHRNRFDEWEWTHPRAYLDYDHAPEPAPADKVKVVYKCDYCHGPDPLWVHWGKDIVRDGKRFGERWSACAICHEAVIRRHVMGVVRQFQRYQPEAERQLMVLDLPVEFRYQVLFERIPSVSRWAPFPDPAKPPRITARTLPRARAQLARYWRSEMAVQALRSIAFEQGGLAMPGIDFHTEEHFVIKLPAASREGVTQFCVRQANCIEVGGLYWISSEFTEMALRAARRMTDLSLATEDMPSRTGLLYYDTPVAELTEQHLTMPVQALSWAIVPHGVWITPYGMTDRIFFNDPLQRERFGMLVPWNSGGGMQFGTHDVAQAPNLAVLLATWAIMQQERFADVSNHAPERKKKRHHTKHTIGEDGRPVRIDDTVTVVDIRRRKRTAREEAEQATSGGRRIDYQMERGAHWKMQAYGTGRSLRKRIWVDSYWVGEEGAPVRYKGEKVVRLK